MKNNKLLLIGWDAADWKIIGPLLAKGLLPSLRKLLDKGVYGNMSTMNPPYSPMLWSSVATGKTPDKHGVLGFIEIMPDKKGVRPVTVNSRKSKAIWNILHNQGLKSNIVGWWPSYPAEPINGVVVTDKFQNVNADYTKSSPLAKGAIHPEHLREELQDLRMFPFEITSEHILPFIPNAANIDQDDKTNGLVAFSKILSQNVSLHNASTYLLRKTEWDFMAIYFDMIDHFCHTFMKYFPPKLPRISQENYDLYKDVVSSAYRFQDMMLGRVLDLIDDQTTVIVMSDHGFESGHKRILDMPKVVAAPALDHRQFGIFVASGPNIKNNEKVFGLGLLDVAPTILHHYGLPIGKDMDGKVIMDIFKEATPPKFIDSWEDQEGDFGEIEKEEEDVFSDEEMMEQLIELGYIERPDEKIEVSILKTKCDLQHNLARVYLGKKDFETAKSILLELLEQKDPINVAPYYIDIMNTCLGLKDYSEAEKYLTEFKNIKTEVNYNIYFIESDILVGNGDLDKAFQVLKDACDRKPNAEVWYRMGNVTYMMQNYEKARDYFQTAIDIEQDKAKYHKGIADAFYELGEYEESADHAYTSIELVKYYPRAHYTFGKALEKLGFLEDAKKAYKVAATLKPKAFPRAERALENIEEKMVEVPEGSLNNDKKDYKYKKDQIVIVSGLPRSGTSLMMQMLAKGGVDILTDENRKADDSNPKGYYEYDPVMSIHKDNSWLDKAQNKGLKVVAPLLKYLSPKYRYKIIFMTRDLNEVVKSQQIMRRKDPEALPVTLFETYKKILKGVKVWDINEPGVELIYIDYKDVLSNTQEIIQKVTSFIGVEMDKEKMAKCIDKSLHRNKS